MKVSWKKVEKGDEKYFQEITEKIANKLKGMGFTDMVGLNPAESLFEYGILRNPETGETILMTFNHQDLFDLYWGKRTITFKEVRNYLEELSEDNSRNNFFDFIGVNPNKYIKSLFNHYLADTIYAINMYDGYFITGCGKDFEDLIDFINSY